MEVPKDLVVYERLENLERTVAQLNITPSGQAAPGESKGFFGNFKLPFTGGSRRKSRRSKKSKKSRHSRR